MGCLSRKGIRTESVGSTDARNYKDAREIEANKSIFQSGIASWYGEKFHGRRTANGEIYDMNKLTAAHRSLPFNTIVEVENTGNNKKVIVRINDRGPFVKNRIVDLSYKAAKRIDIDETGTAHVSLKILKFYGKKIEIDDYRHETKFVLQAGAFIEIRNAKRMKKKINSIIPRLKFDIYFNEGFYRVISEKIGTRSEAEEYMKTLIYYKIDVFIKKI